MKTLSKPASKSGRDYIKSWTVNGANGPTTYNRLRYGSHPEVKLPNGPRYSKPVQDAAKIALQVYLDQEAEQPAQDKKKRGDTLGAALSRYFDTPAFQTMRSSTREKRRYILNALGKRYGDCVLSELTDETVEKWLAAREATPAAARNLLVALQHFFSERIGAGLLKKRNNPVLGVRLEKRVARKVAKGHYKTWKQAHVDQFRAHWPMGTMERLAFEIMLLTGMSAADVIRFSRSWVGADNIIRYRRRKTSSEGMPLFSKELRAAIAACPLAAPADRPFEPILRGPSGVPWYAIGETCGDTDEETDEGWRNQHFSQWFTKAARAAGLPEGYSAHGVRKRAACDDCLKSWPQAQLMGKYGWTDPKEVVLYTLEAEKELFMLAEAAKDAAD